MSIVCPSFLIFPWQPLVSCRFGQKLDMILYFFFRFLFVKFQKFTNLYISQAFWLHFVSISVISWLFKKKVKSKMSNLRWRDIIWRHKQQIWYHFVERAHGYLINVILFFRALKEWKPNGVPCTSPLYHAGRTSELVPPRVKIAQQNT